LEFLRRKLGRLARKAGALKEQPVDFGPQRAHAPMFLATHFGIKVPLERIFERQQFDPVAPVQLLRQRRNNVRIGELFGKLHHARKRRFGPTAPELLG
jgi:hypothetical protein